MYLPILYILGNVHTALSMVAFLFLCFNFLAKGRDNVLIVSFLFIIIFGDSRQTELAFFKDLRIVGILVMMIATIRDLIKRKYRFRPLAFIVILFTILAFLSISQSPIKGTAVQKTISYSFLLFIVLHYWNFHIWKNSKTLYRDIILLVILIYFIGLITYGLGMRISIFNTRFRGFFGNPNGHGIHATLFTMLLFFYLKAYPEVFSKRQKRIFFAILIACILLCGSRNTLASVLLFFFLLYFVGGGVFKKTIFFILVVPFAVSVVNLEFIVWIITKMGLSQELRIESILSGTGRFHAWEYAMSVYQDHKWLGRGFGYDQKLFEYGTLPEWLMKTGHQGDSHNSYIALLLNVGIIGLSTLLLFFIQLLRKVRYPGAGLAIGLGAGFSAFFEPWLSSSLNAYTALLFLVILFATHFPKNRIRNI
ncbi:MAG: O-antigen ligase family protein [Bacteroidota bacterium]